MWYYNAGEAPTKEILAHQPNLVHRQDDEVNSLLFEVDLYLYLYIPKQCFGPWIRIRSFIFFVIRKNILIRIRKLKNRLKRLNFP